MEKQDYGAIVDQARRSALACGARQLERACAEYSADEYPTACFLAMTAIEECGKAVLLGMPRRVATHLREGRYVIPERNMFRKTIRDHSGKSVAAAVDALMINAAADRRQGIHPTSGVHRTSGVVLLGRSTRWMEVRNACLYVDVDIGRQSVRTPAEVITEAHANYFIRMGFEIAAESGFAGLAAPGPDAPLEEAFEWQSRQLALLGDFMEQHQVDLDDLWFLRDSEQLREAAEKRESRKP